MQNAQSLQALELQSSQFNSKKSLLMKITVAISESQNESILIHDGETATEVAHKFALRHQLDTETEFILKDQIEQNMI